MSDFINNLRQMVSYEASDIIEDIKSLGYVLAENFNDLTIYSFKDINDDSNIIIDIMVITTEQEESKEFKNNLFYNSSSSSLMKKDYYIMDKGVSRIRVKYDGFINMNPADAILELQDIDKYITDLVSEIVRCIIIYSSNINYTVEDEYKNGNKTGYKIITFNIDDDTPAK